MTDLAAVVETARARGYGLTPFGQLLADIIDYNTEHPITRPELAADNQREAKRAAPAKPASISPDLVRARLAGNQARLRGVEHRLAVLIDAGPTDPQLVDIPHHRRPGAITDAQLERWSRLTRYATRLRHKIALDEARLAKAGPS